jgi:hypothetical protein
MIRFAWLQTRTQILVAIGALAAIAVVILATGPHLHHLYDVNVATCRTETSCDLARTAFLKNDKALASWLGGLMLAVPAIIGVFWGPPLVARELEAGTFRLAWTQSVSRTRWFLAKLAVVGLTAMAVSGVLGLLVSWWAGPRDTVTANRFDPPLFDERGVVIIGYTAFALAVGVTAGVVLRRTLPAMATTLVVFVAAKLAVIAWIRPRFQAAAARTIALDAVRTGFGRRNSGPLTLQPEPPQIPDAWIHSVRIVDSAGHTMPPSALEKICPNLGKLIDAPPPPGGGPTRVKAPDDLRDSLRSCVAKVATKYHEVVRYQPAKRYWVFQWYELALFLGVTLALCAFCVWWIRRRLA